MPRFEANPPVALWRARLREIIFEADTPLGKAFDVVLLLAIGLSVLAVMLDSVAGVHSSYGQALRLVEWFFTIIFTIEYVLRLVSVRKRLSYATSFLGLVDLLSIVPTYLSFFLAGAQSLLIIRSLRLLRIFRVLKVAQFLHEVTALTTAIRNSRAKIIVFLMAVLITALIMGSAMYVIEGEASGFTSIPRGVYWAIVTVTTVGYGDIAPKSVPGQIVAAAAMVLGYSLIIIPTGIFSMELVRAARKDVTTQSCPECLREGHDQDAVFCKYCGAAL